jgi:hypothetical protein
LDRKLDELLSGYKVKDADKALVDRIVVQAAQQGDMRRFGIWRQCAMFAVIAALGFWLGNLQGQSVVAGHTAATSAASSTQEQPAGTPGQQLLGPDSLSDLML